MQDHFFHPENGRSLCTEWPTLYIFSSIYVYTVKNSLLVNDMWEFYKSTRLTNQQHFINQTNIQCALINCIGLFTLTDQQHRINYATAGMFHSYRYSRRTFNGYTHTTDTDAVFETSRSTGHIRFGISGISSKINKL